MKPVTLLSPTNELDLNVEAGLSPKSDEDLLLRSKKNQGFYVSQINKIRCQKAKQLVPRTIEPNFYVSRDFMTQEEI